MVDDRQSWDVAREIPEIIDALLFQFTACKRGDIDWNVLDRFGTPGRRDDDFLQHWSL
ncbi:MAG: hypothetical protein O7H40_15080 [Gammaproteobacteria bacterium]|nr:hypothetical protein [Gammaproteobacteria bacterium]